MHLSLLLLILAARGLVASGQNRGRGSLDQPNRPQIAAPAQYPPRGVLPNTITTGMGPPSPQKHTSQPANHRQKERSHSTGVDRLPLPRRPVPLEGAGLENPKSQRQTGQAGGRLAAFQSPPIGEFNAQGHWPVAQNPLPSVHAPGRRNTQLSLTTHQQQPIVKPQAPEPPWQGQNFRAPGISNPSRTRPLHDSNPGTGQLKPGVNPALSTAIQSASDRMRELMSQGKLKFNPKFGLPQGLPDSFTNVKWKPTGGIESQANEPYPPGVVNQGFGTWTQASSGGATIKKTPTAKIAKTKFPITDLSTSVGPGVKLQRGGARRKVLAPQDIPINLSNDELSYANNNAGNAVVLGQRSQTPSKGRIAANPTILGSADTRSRVHEVITKQGITRVLAGQTLDEPIVLGNAATRSRARNAVSEERKTKVSAAQLPIQPVESSQAKRRKTDQPLSNYPLPPTQGPLANTQLLMPFNELMASLSRASSSEEDVGRPVRAAPRPQQASGIRVQPLVPFAELMGSLGRASSTGEGASQRRESTPFGISRAASQDTTSSDDWKIID